MHRLKSGNVEFRCIRACTLIIFVKASIYAYNISEWSLKTNLCISCRIAIDVVEDDPAELEPWRCWDGEVGELPWCPTTALGTDPTSDIDMIPAPTEPGLVPGFTRTPPPGLGGPPPPKNDDKEAEEEWGEAPGWWAMPTPDAANCEGDGRSIVLKRLFIYNQYLDWYS